MARGEDVLLNIHRDSEREVIASEKNMVRRHMQGKTVSSREEVQWGNISSGNGPFEKGASGASRTLSSTLHVAVEKKKVQNLLQRGGDCLTLRENYDLIFSIWGLQGNVPLALGDITSSEQ